MEFWQLMHPDSRDVVKRRGMARQAGQKMPTSYKVRIIRKDGESRWLNFSGDLIDYEGVPAVLGIAHDITESVAAELTLRERLAFEGVVAGISTRFINLPSQDIDAGIHEALEALGRFTDVDRSYVFLYSDDGTSMSNTHEWCAPGIQPAMPDLQDLPGGTFPWFDKKIRNLEAVHVPCVSEVPPEASAERTEWTRESIQSLVTIPMVYSGNLIGFVGFDSVRKRKTWSADIIALLRIVGEVFANALQRKQSEHQLRLLTSAVEQSADGVAVVDLAGHVLFINDAFANMHGYDSAELIGRHLSVFHTASQKPAVDAANMQMAETGEFEGEVWHVRRDGAVFLTSMRNVIVRDEAGEPVAMLGTARDITERKRAEEALRESESRNRTYFASSPYGMYVVNASGRYIEVNEAIAENLVELDGVLNTPKTVVFEKTPSRNDPCSCGSGKKYKKCCG